MCMKRKSMKLWKRMGILLAAGMFVSQMTGCGSIELPIEQEQKEIEDTYVPVNRVMEVKPKWDTFDQAYLHFTFDLMRRSKKEQENMMISPLSLMTALTMTANGADRNTRAQMEEVLYQGNRMEEMSPLLLEYIQKLPSTEQVSMKQANSIWIRDDFPVKDDFLKENQEQYGAEIYQKEFDDRMVGEINNWVDDKTDHMIDAILQKLNPDAVMYLINAIAFEGKWDTMYEEYQIHKDSLFTPGSGDVETVTMLFSEENTYFQDEDTIGFCKPYRDGYSFAAFLPKEEGKMDEYLAEWDEKKWENLMKTMENDTVVDVQIPCFVAEYECEMSELLKAAGMTDAFDGDMADFSRMADLNEVEKLYIGSVKHKTYIELDENGTKASAVTSVEIAEGCAEPVEIKSVVLDRPFVYAIIEDETQLPIFMGVVEHVGETQ